MLIPLRISFHGIGRSDLLRASIRDNAQKLDRYYPHVISSRVVLELSGKHKRHGRSFIARVDLKVPGGEIVVNKGHDEDVHVAIRDAFDAARRRLEDYARTRRGDVKKHRERTRSA